MLPYQSPSRVVDSTAAGRRPVSAGRAASACTGERPSVREPTVRHRRSSITNTTAGAIVIWICARNRVGSGRNPGRVCPDNLDTDTGRERPGSPGLRRPRCAGGRVLTPLSSSHLLFSGRPGRQKAPADRDTDIGASIGSYEASQPRRMVGRRLTVHLRLIMPMVDGAAGPLAIGPPPRPPRVETWPRTETSKGREKTPLNAPGWMRSAGDGVTIRERRTALWSSVIS